MEKILKCSFSITEPNSLKLNLLRQWLIKYQMSSWPVTFYPRPLIWTATYLWYLNIFFSEITGLFDGLFIRLFRSLDQNVYGKNKICSIISCSWPWPILTLLRRSGERLRTFRSSSFLKTDRLWYEINIPFFSKEKAGIITHSFLNLAVDWDVKILTRHYYSKAIFRSWHQFLFLNNIEKSSRKK